MIADSTIAVTAAGTRSRPLLDSFTPSVRLATRSVSVGQSIKSAGGAPQVPGRPTGTVRPCRRPRISPMPRPDWGKIRRRAGTAVSDSAPGPTGVAHAWRRVPPLTLSQTQGEPGVAGDEPPPLRLLSRRRPSGRPRRRCPRGLRAPEATRRTWSFRN